MFGESLVTILFRLLNFAALGGLVWYIFQKYFKQSIEESIENDRLEEINVDNQISDLEHRSLTLNQEIIKQEQLCEYLTDQTARWKELFEKEVQNKQQNLKVSHIQAQLRLEKQAEIIAKERMIKAVAPQAIEHARAKLVASYSNHGHNKKFIDGIIDFIQKSS